MKYYFNNGIKACIFEQQLPHKNTELLKKNNDVTKIHQSSVCRVCESLLNIFENADICVKKCIIKCIIINIFIQADLRSQLRPEPCMRISQRIIQEYRKESKASCEKKIKNKNTLIAPNNSQRNRHEINNLIPSI